MSPGRLYPELRFGGLMAQQLIGQPGGFLLRGQRLGPIIGRGQYVACGIQRPKEDALLVEIRGGLHHKGSLHLSGLPGLLREIPRSGAPDFPGHVNTMATIQSARTAGKIKAVEPVHNRPAPIVDNGEYHDCGRLWAWRKLDSAWRAEIVPAPVRLLRTDAPDTRRAVEDVQSVAASAV